MKRYVSFALFCFFFLLKIDFVCAQGQANMWYMYSNVGLNFNTVPPTPLLDGAMSSQITCSISGITSGEGEGCASIADAAGNLLFYTNGVKVFDQTHTIIPGLVTTDMLGNQSAAQSAIIIPKPGSTTQYYIFTVPADPGATYNGTNCGSRLPSDGLRYTLIDMSLVGNGVVGAPLGDVVVGSINIQVTPPGIEIMEMLTAVPDNNTVSPGYWVLCHERGSNNFYSYHVTSTGVTAATGSPYGVGNASAIGGTSIGLMKANACFNKIAYVYYAHTTGIQVTDFDNSTGRVGQISNVSFVTGFSSITDLYGIEWSPNGLMIYATQLTTNMLYQLTLASNTITYSLSTPPGGSANRTCQLQIGPDNKIYLSRHYRFSASNGDVTCIGVIDQPNTSGAGCNVALSAYCWTKASTNGFWTAHGLPQFTKGFVGNTVDFTPTKVCINVPVNFVGTYTGTVANPITWDFNGDAVTDASNTLTPSAYTYTAPGVYNVTLSVTDAACLYTKTITQPVTVYDNTPTFTTNSSSCSSSFTINATGAGTANYQYWSAATGGTLLGTGASYTSNGPWPVTIYVVNETPVSGPYTVGNTDATAAFASDLMTTYFSTSVTTFISSVQLRVRAAGTFNVFIQNTAGTVNHFGPLSVTTTAGQVNTLITVPININLAAGSYRLFTDAPLSLLFRNNTSLDGGRDVNGIINVIGQDNPSATKGGPFANIALKPVTGCSYRIAQSLDCALPVTLVSFDGELYSGRVTLSWTSAMETLFERYEIEYSHEMNSWTTIASLIANNKGNTVSNYEYVHANPANGQNYYRLKMVNTDGSFSYSKIVQVYQDNGEAFVQPNPFSQTTSIIFSKPQTAQFLIYDLMGRLVFTYNSFTALQEFTIGESLLKGAYILNVITPSESALYKIIKE